jgi:transcriptional regulator with XRE-family HTH domain
VVGGAAAVSRQRAANEIWAPVAGRHAQSCLPCSLEPHVIVSRTRTHSQSDMKRSHPTEKHVGRRLRMRRLMLKKSQRDVANALELTFQQVQKYENGSSRISAGRLQALCTILQVPVSFFFEGSLQEPTMPTLVSDEQSPSYVDEFLATPDGVALAVAFGRIRRPRVRRAIVALVEQIVVEPVERISDGSEEPTVAAVE